MKQEDKELLLQDLCARLPYKPFAQWHHKALNEFRDVKIMRVSTYGENIDDYHINVLCQPEPGVDYEASIVDIKPYLRPMYSMTSEEIHEFQEILRSDIEVGYGFVDIINSSIHVLSFLELHALFDWLKANHFDYLELIPKGLAIEVTKENNPY